MISSKLLRIKPQNLLPREEDIFAGLYRYLALLSKCSAMVDRLNMRYFLGAWPHMHFFGRAIHLPFTGPQRFTCEKLDTSLLQYANFSSPVIKGHVN